MRRSFGGLRPCSTALWRWELGFHWTTKVDGRCCSAICRKAGLLRQMLTVVQKPLFKALKGHALGTEGVKLRTVNTPEEVVAMPSFQAGRVEGNGP
jgi:hypothetical protein